MNKSKLTIPFLLLLLLTSSVLSQQRNTPANENSLYHRALFASLEKMNKEWGRADDAATDGRVRTDYRNMIVEKNRYISEGLPSQFGDYRVEFLEPQELIDRYKKLRKEFAILVSIPMIDEGERLRITFNVYWISYKKHNLNYALSDWSKVYFRYDCEKRGFIVDEVTLGGI